ncbi:transmembrane protein PVRIG [Ornithorhynchus anatinus]|uniref:transmembrane protein PVRIG n=1 Tax=Ornithorhynchus anatinus TaxID=9258 RepID=UPI0010A7F903|nr:transmembrane protein PVRIG [Ornithorhynchus anatinus]
MGSPLLPPLLLTLCLGAGVPSEPPPVRVEVREAGGARRLLVRCLFLGRGSVSQVAVSLGGPDGEGGRALALLDPRHGIRRAPAVDASWDSDAGVSLTVERPDPGPPAPPNATFCCKFATFPTGTWEACAHLEEGDASDSPKDGASAPSGVRLRADLLGLLGVSAALLLGCFCLLRHMLRRRLWTPPSLWKAGPWTRTGAKRKGPEGPHTPYVIINMDYFSPPSPPPGPPQPCPPIPSSQTPTPASRPKPPAPRNRLYHQTPGGRGRTLTPGPDPPTRPRPPSPPPPRPQTENGPGRGLGPKQACRG